MSKVVLIELHFLPSLEYFCALQGFEQVCIEKHEHFVKQSYRNRCYINTSQGVEPLTVPLKGKHSKIPIKDIQVDSGKRWQDIVWRSLESGYRKAPFYEHFADDLRKTIYSKTPLLFDLNMQMLSFCLNALNWHLKVSETDAYENSVALPVSDFRSVITIKKTFLERDFYRPIPYYQVFGQTFKPNLSLVDLIFCAGPGAGSILLASSINRLNK